MLLDVIFTILALSGSVFIFWKREKCLRYPMPLVIVFFLWALGSLYLSIVALTISDFRFIYPILLFLIFFWSWRLEKRRVLNGLLFNLFLGVFFLYALHLRLSANYFILHLTGNIGLIIFGIFFLFGFIALLLFLFANSYVMKKRETVKLANMLTLVAGFALIFLQILTFIDINTDGIPLFVRGIIISSTPISVYFMVLFANYLTASILYNLQRPKLDKEYIIVLGAGLVKGKYVGPLLQQRIKRGIAFAKKQESQTGKLPKMIMSGGQGADEIISEASAMATFAIQEGFPKDKILQEDKSTTTFENMKFSKQVMENDCGKENPTAVFASNNYHLLRAGIYARMSGIKADGIGARTAKYFIPNGFLREFMAILFMKKWRHVVIVALIIIGSITLEYVQYYFAR